MKKAEVGRPQSVLFILFVSTGLACFLLKKRSLPHHCSCPLYSSYTIMYHRILTSDNPASHGLSLLLSKCLCVAISASLNL